MAHSEGTGTEMQCCLLEFRPHGWGHILRPRPKAQLLIIKCPDGGLQFYIERDFQLRVKGEDLDFLLSLVRDFPARAKIDSGALFEQLCSLYKGPMTTREVFSRDSDDTTFVEFKSKFVTILWG